MTKASQGPTGRYRIYDTHNDKTVAKGESISSVLSKFFGKAKKHNKGDRMENWFDRDLSFSDAEFEFGRGFFEIQKEFETKKTEWRDIDE